MFSGWADEAMFPLATVKFYDEIVKVVGGAAKAGSIRLYMIPGQNHDPHGDGPVLGAPDFLPALEAWVESKTAPEAIVAKETRNGVVTRTRPVFPYPLAPNYRRQRRSERCRQLYCPRRDSPVAMPELKVTVTDGLLRALQNFAAAKREPVADIVAQALSDYMQIAHSTLYQVSTSSALVEGVYEGAVTVKTLREHGDHGLGTFDHLDGEMIVIDGHFFQVRSDEIPVRECEDDALTPFAVITHFVPEPATRVSECGDFDRLCAHFEGLRSSDNLF